MQELLLLYLGLALDKFAEEHIHEISIAEIKYTLHEYANNL